MAKTLIQLLIIQKPSSVQQNIEYEVTYKANSQQECANEDHMVGIVTRSVETKAVLQPESEVEAIMATIAKNCGENEINATNGQICRIDDTDATIEQICEKKGIAPQFEQHNMEGKQKSK